MAHHQTGPADSSDETGDGRLDGTATSASDAQAAADRALHERFKHLDAEIAERRRAMAVPAGSAARQSQKAARPSGGGNHGRWAEALGALLILAVAVTLVALPGLHLGRTKKAVAEPTPASAASAAAAAKPTGTPGSATVLPPPSLDPARAAVVDKPWPPITATVSFPDTTARLASGLVMQRVATAKQVPCDSFASQQMAQLIDQGSGCSQLITALYTTPDHKAQFTVDVLTMNRAEDAADVAGMAKIMASAYQMGSMDPPAGSPLPTIPAGNGGVSDSLMAVRSVVFVNAQWVDPGSQDANTLTAEADSLLNYVDAKVAAYETSQTKG